MDNQELEEKLIDFSVQTIQIAELINNSFVGRHLSSQLVRCGTTVSLNYAEVQIAQNQKEFDEKMKLVKKDLRETLVCLKIIQRINLVISDSLIQDLIQVNETLLKSIDMVQSETDSSKSLVEVS